MLLTKIGYPLAVTILILVLLLACVTNEKWDHSGKTEKPQITDCKQIKIIKINQHPFLSDHCRKLRTLDKAQNIIDEAFLNIDTGSGCDAYLFEDARTYTIVDCNAFWFLIDKMTGKITEQGWKWDEKLPNQTNVGVFTRSHGKDYLLISPPDTIITKSMIYTEKDPNPNDCK